MVMSVAVLSALVFFVISQVAAALNINGTVHKLKILVMICFIVTPSAPPWPIGRTFPLLAEEGSGEVCENPERSITLSPCRIRIIHLLWSWLLSRPAGLFPSAETGHQSVSPRSRQ
jgi:hypothetical protein